MKFINFLVFVCLPCSITICLCSCQTSNESVSLPTGDNCLAASEIVKRIQENVNCEWSEKTVDTIKAGDPETPITGITTTGFATMEVLKQAAASGHNFIITHEPTFYNHYDKFERLEGDFVQESKLAFIKEHNLVVFRFHDHWHRHEPDGIYVGMIEALGLEKYRVEGEKRIFDIPETTTHKLALDIKKKLNARGAMRGVGDPKQKVSRVGLVLGSPSSMNHFGMFQRDDLDLVIAGENPEWETTEYVRDAISLGKEKGLLLIGHNNSEEGGMKYCKDWLQTFMPEMPIEFVPAGDPFWSP